jgi:osmoprotectant transport system substrate-binding protein
MTKVRTIAFTAGLALLAVSCSPAKKSLVVGSKSTTEQTLVAEIVAQHLENRLKYPIERRVNQGNTSLIYQALVGGQIALYPEYTGIIEDEILKEPAPRDMKMLYERTKGEMARTAQLELFPSLGYENSPVVVVRKADAERAKVSTLSQVAASPEKWRVGVSFEFQQRKDGIPGLTSYKIPMAAGIRGMDAGQLWPALDKGDVTMITAEATDGHLSSDAYRILEDDKRAFPFAEACLLVRQDAMTNEPLLRPALTELNGKMPIEAIRKMTGQIDHDHRTAAEVAKEFLASIGLK